ncbi:MAG: hypothetical protein PVH88_11240 [Ignavibacteria bacterium]|jgi:hypothetical protein
MKNNYIDIAKNMRLWFIEKQYKGNDPFQVDEKVFSKINKLPIANFIRKVLKPFHSYLPSNSFFKFPSIYHPKTIGLVIAGNANLYQITSEEEVLNENLKLLEILEERRSPGYKHIAWGHPFEWGQLPRYPKDTPFVCVTCPVTHGLLDYYKISGNSKSLEMCIDAANGLLNESGYDNISDDIISLYYSPLDKKYVYNSDIMAASFLYRLNQIHPKKEYIEFANKLINFVISGQNEDGSWIYADKRGEQRIDTIDNRHTSFVLEAFQIINDIRKDNSLTDVIEKGKKYYLGNLFEGPIPKWSPQKTYPIDIHDIANAIITLTKLGEIEKAEAVFDFALEKMFNGRDQFYYKLFADGRVNKTVFIRWGQAWMYKAIAEYILKNEVR